MVVAVFCVGNLGLISGEDVPKWDAADYFGPEFSLVADHVKAGRLVLWDPWMSSGSPDSAEPEFGTTSPVMLSLALISQHPQSGFVTYWMFIWILGPLGIVVLCRHLECPAWGAVIAAIAFGACGVYTNHAEHTAHIYSVSFLPWVLWRFDVALARRSYWPAVEAGALWGLSALGGYPVYTIVTPGFLLLWAAGRQLNGGLPKLRGYLRYSVLFFLLFLVTGVAVLSPAYVAFMKDTAGYSDRNGTRTRDSALHENILPVAGAFTVASPYLGLLEVPPCYFWPHEDVSMRSIYAGSLAAILALFALTGKARWRWWLLFMGLLALACAAGYQLPIRGWLYDFVPPTRYFRNAASFRTYAILMAVILCALATKDLSSPTKTPDDPSKLRLALASLFLTVFSICAFLITNKLAVARFSPAQPAAILFGVLWASIVAIAVLYWLNKVRGRAFYALLVGVAIFDGLSTLYISRPTLYTSNELMRTIWREVDARHDASLNLSQKEFDRQLYPPASLNYEHPTVNRNNRNLPLKVAALLSENVVKNRFYLPIETDPALAAFALGPNRIWFTADAPIAPPSDANFAAYVGRVKQSDAPVVVLHSPSEMLEISRSEEERAKQPPTAAINPNAFASATSAQLSHLAYWPNSLSFHYAADKPGWLVVTDRWAPGWHATVNGKPQEVMGANFVFRAVKVEPGENIVEFRYRPFGWPYLLIVSWGALLLVAIVDILRFTKAG